MGLNWMKKGEASAKLAKQQEVEAEQSKKEQGKLFRFWLKDKESAQITFIDGALTPDGFLLPPRYWEHNLYLNGNWNNYYVCPAKSDPDGGHKCPICESGDKPSLISLFSIIDHRTFPGKNDKKYVNTRKLLAVKPITFELLNKAALKRGGLAGCTFEVSRIGDKAAAVGSVFDFETKEEDLNVLKAKYMVTIKDEKGVEVQKTNFEPADYETEIVYRTEQELRDLGFGKPSMSPPFSGGTATSATDYSKEL